MDLRLAGLWQGVGQLGCKRAVVPWCVLSEGDARQLIMRQHEGRIDAEDEHLTLRANLEQEVAGRYVGHTHEILKVILPKGAAVGKSVSPAALCGPCGTPGFGVQ
jgi:hypothetical protein